MQKQQSARRLSLGLIAGVSVAVLAAGGGTAWWAVKSIMSSDNPIKESNRVVDRQESIISNQEAQVYWLNIVGDKTELIPTQVTIESTADSSQKLNSALQSLLAGPQGNFAYTTTIPQGTQLLDLKVKNKEIHINLSQEFTSGGGSASMVDRLGQILYTASSLDPESKVWIKVEGEPLEVLGGEGIMIAQPLTRQEFEKDFSL
jgi:spore germination protein GerM